MSDTSSEDESGDLPMDQTLSGGSNLSEDSYHLHKSPETSRRSREQVLEPNSTLPGRFSSQFELTSRQCHEQSSIFLAKTPLPLKTSTLRTLRRKCATSSLREIPQDETEAQIRTRLKGKSRALSDSEDEIMLPASEDKLTCRCHERRRKGGFGDFSRDR